MLEQQKKKGPGRPKDEAKALLREQEKAAAKAHREQVAAERAAAKAANPPRGPGRPKDPAKAEAREEAKAAKALLREQAKASRKAPLPPPPTTDEGLRAENAMLRVKLGEIMLVLKSLST